MGILSTAIYESFQLDEDFQDEVLDSLEETGSLEEVNEEPIEESLITESSSDISKAIDEYQELLRQDIPPAKAKSMVTGEEEVKESLTESRKMNTKSKYDPEVYMRKVVEQYRKAAKFSLDEELTEEKLKNEDWRIKNIAMRAAVPSSALREALLKGNVNNEN